MTIHDRLLVPENLNYAWNKAKRLYSTLDGYIDNGELADFELNLEQRLITIQKQFEKGTWNPKKLRPLPRPKKIENSTAIDRQYYHVAVDDQVAWIAVANALGPELDLQMPPWSYGNRLYRPAWYEHGEDRQSTLEIGPYRHASGHLYRKFQHSWPAVSSACSIDRTKRWHELCHPIQKSLIVRTAWPPFSAEREGLPYLKHGFWAPREEHHTRIYHASFDLRHFYPSPAN